MQLDLDTCYRAVASRDVRFEGRFFVGVTSTGIYCRPGCPAPIPKQKNTRFFACAAAAEEAGFRACLRCRPELAAPFAGTSSSVTRALRLIAGGALDEAGVSSLADRLGIGERHLRRLFRDHLGASPLAVARTRRVHFARKLLEQSELPMTTVAMCAGFASIRRFNQVMRETFGRTPTELRPRVRERDAGALRLTLRARPPYDFARLCEFLGKRAIPGIEELRDGVYRRTVQVGEQSGWIEVRASTSTVGLELRLDLDPSTQLITVVERVARVFDVATDPLAIAAHLRRDPFLRPLVDARPGLRVPGAWDGFELGVRAILGQQISVARATVLAGKLVAAYGAPLPSASGALTHLFPTPAVVAEADVAAALGMPRARGEAIRQLAAAVRDGRVRLDGTAPTSETLEALVALPGIGDWTAQYIAMRALGEPDAFVPGDLGVRQALADENGMPGATAVAARAEAWRPWRAYAALHLWNA